jgi:hypothetical protein
MSRPRVPTLEELNWSLARPALSRGLAVSLPVLPHRPATGVAAFFTSRNADALSAAASRKEMAQRYLIKQSDMFHFAGGFIRTFPEPLNVVCRACHVLSCRKLRVAPTRD